MACQLAAVLKIKTSKTPKNTIKRVELVTVPRHSRGLLITNSRELQKGRLPNSFRRKSKLKA